MPAGGRPQSPISSLFVYGVIAYVINLTLANRIRSVKPSATLAVTNQANELRAAGKDIIGLGAGEPDFDTPQHIKQAAIDAINAGKTKYTAVDGTPGLKQAVIEKFRRDNGLTYGADQILVSAGGKHTFYNLAQALLSAGDEVIIPAPYWVSYPDMVLLAGGVPVLIGAGIRSRFKIRAEQLEAAITPRTKLFVLNSPSNPSGMSYTRDELAQFGDVLRRQPHVLIATDDIYEHIVWSPEGFNTLLNVCPDLIERSIVINGVSKAYAMTGWRIGYCAGPAPLVKAMKVIQSQSTSNPSSISQAAAQAALSGDQGCIAPMRAAFKRRHDQVVAALNAMPGVRCLAGDGTFYTFADFSDAISRLDGVADDVQLAAHLLDHAGVALVPGSAFGVPGCGRISFATSDAALDQAMDRMRRFFNA